MRRPGRGEPAPAPAGPWDDLRKRLATGVLVAVVGVGSIWLGGTWFHVFVAAACGIMVWELARMLGAPATAQWPGLAAAAALLLAGFLPGGFALPLILAPALFRSDEMKGNRLVFALYTFAIMIAGYGLMGFRDDEGRVWMLWLISVVIATDIGGYFAGRLIGGPKFWPKLSPKKTWAGTTAGWVAAAIVSIPFLRHEGAGVELLGIAIAVSMASQLGDIAESAVKRRSGVKDSSALLPGHGGLFDRFDSMLGASVFLLLAKQIVDFPPPPLG